MLNVESWNCAEISYGIDAEWPISL